MQLYRILEETLRATPDKAALVFGERTASYRDVQSSMSLCARALISLGIGRGDRVAIYLENRPEFVELYLACFRIGAVAVPLNHRFQAAEVAFAANHCGARLLIVDESLSARLDGLGDSVPSLEGVYVLGDAGPASFRAWSAVLADVPEAPAWPQVEEDDPAMILYTSGSTGKPKGVTHTHRSIFRSAASRGLTQRLTGDDVALAATAICHVGAALGVTFPTLLAGGTVVLLERTDPLLFLEALRRHRPTRTVILPTQLLDAVEHPQAQAGDFACLREVQCGGDQISHDLYEHFGKVASFELNQIYGLTECEGVCMNPPFGEIRRGSIGKPREGVEIRLAVGDGKDADEGEAGEILIRSDSMMTGYWNDPGSTGRTLVDGWLRTGDLARKGADGCYYFIGRIKEIIIKGGSNIAPGEVEEVLDDHPDVVISGVVAMPDRRLGEIVHAFVALRPGLDAVQAQPELSAFAAGRLAAYKVPDRWTFVDELPRNEVGKIDRRGLHALAANRDAR